MEDITFTPEDVKRISAKYAGDIALKAGIISFIAGFIFAYMTFSIIHM